MNNHASEIIGNDEPEGGWVTAPTLADSQILTIALCRYTGDKPEREGLRCQAREAMMHADVDCVTLYHQAEALASGVIRYDMTAPEVTQSAAGDDPTYVAPVS
jgi:hypothetical protein